jgi:pimeloyl-ACP methyl ester carboxylesterase
MRLTPGDHALDLPDGRTVGFTVYGDPAGSPVLNCHGGLVSGHDVGPADVAARSLGMCVISPDRPGINRTDRLPGHGLLPWVRSDLMPLLDHLEVDAIGVMGWSEGGQYALAAAFGLEGRVTRCAVIAGCPPLDDPATRKDLNRLDRTLAVLARRFPPAVHSVALGNRLLARRLPNALLRNALRGQPSAEVSSVREQGRWLPTILGEGAANSRGVVDEYRAFVAPWGFDPGDLSTPVQIYQGSDDTLVPESWGRQLAQRIPGASLVVFPGEGHFIALTRRREVMQWLAGT